MKRKRDSNEEKSEIFIRSTPHIDGDWPSFVFVEVKKSKYLLKIGELSIQQFKSVCSSHMVELSDVVAHESDKWHLSVSRVFSLRIQHIARCFSLFEQNLKCLTPEIVEYLPKMKILFNDPKTRGFACIVVKDNFNNFLSRLLSIVNDIIQRFQEKPFYSDPEFHISVASCLPSASLIGEELTEHSILPREGEEEQWVSDDCFPVTVRHVSIQVGCKLLKIDLGNHGHTELLDLREFQNSTQNV